MLWHGLLQLSKLDSPWRTPNVLFPLLLVLFPCRLHCNSTQDYDISPEILQMGIPFMNAIMKKLVCMELHANT